MSHAEDHLVARAVGPAGELGADRLVTAGLLPERRGHRDREKDLLPVGAVHLVPDDRLDLSDYPATGHI